MKPDKKNDYVRQFDVGQAFLQVVGSLVLEEAITTLHGQETCSLTRITETKQGFDCEVIFSDENGEKTYETTSVTHSRAIKLIFEHFYKQLSQ